MKEQSNHVNFQRSGFVMWSKPFQTVENLNNTFIAMAYLVIMQRRIMTYILHRDKLALWLIKLSLLSPEWTHHSPLLSLRCLLLESKQKFCPQLTRYCQFFQNTGNPVVCSLYTLSMAQILRARAQDTLWSSCRLSSFCAPKNYLRSRTVPVELN